LPASDDPYLVLLHGTFSTTGSSFGRLFRSADWMELSDVYATRVVGLNHRTLSESPAQNALDLVKQLPAKARLHLLTHSRGGLVGELLALGPLPPEALTSLAFAGRTDEEIKALRDLSDLLREKQVRVERFVRVACPARGTILASERLDRYLSVLLNLIGLIPAVDETLIYPFAKAAILSLIKQHTRPDQLPGLEAMMPESPFIRLLNLQGVASSTDLAVIAGDVEGSGLFGRLGVLAADLFYWQDHDLVVNTDSMFKGADRETGIYYSYEKGPEITHFNYFKNDISRQRIKAWLVRKPTDPIPAGFQKLEGEPIPEIRRDLSRGGVPDARDVVFLIPTLMGTHLRIGDKRIWLDLGRLGEGEFAKLRLDGSKGTVAVDEIATWGYGEFSSFLSERFAVIPFPYDWRNSLAAEGARLADELEKELRKHKRPVHLLAHGSGGLVALGLIARKPDTWKQLTARGGRLVMLGTPSRGTAAAVQLLNGRARVAQMLALLDPGRKVDSPKKADAETALETAAKQVASVFRTFPGVLELLPEDSSDNVWDVAWWKKEQIITGEEDESFSQRLQKAREVREEIKPSKTLSDPTVMAKNVCWVASGAAPSDMSDTLEGDASLDFTTGAYAAPEGASTWYMNATPGAMTQRTASFGAFAELLERGSTDQLSRDLSSQGRILPEPTANAPVLFPTAEELAAAAFGRRPRRRREKDTIVLRVSVAHGSLEHAAHPIAVGHYYSDAIVGAEGFLDRKLNGRLSRRYAMKLYPGEAETTETILTPGKHPPGALVIGLGEVGALSPEVLTRGVMTAALRHAITLLESGAQPSDERNYISAAFSSVLIGSSGGHALSVESSVASIVKGAVLANRVLRDQDLWKRVRIDEVQFVELYEDIAAHIGQIVRDLRDDPLSIGLEKAEVIEPRDRLRTLEGGQLRSPASAYDSGWWRRVQISEIGKEPGVKLAGGLEFVLLTDRARAEQTRQAIQRPLVDGLVAEAIRRNDFRADLHATLYEVLLPNTIKDQVKETANLMLVLDPVAANYPWEMLCERGQDPLAVRFGLLRQLKTQRFRPDVRTSRDNRALVIGDPDTGDPSIPRLLGAREEAELVAKELKKSGYEVVEKIDRTALENTSALYAQEYRIVHITAHGSYDLKHPERSGVVLAKDRFLTAFEFDQLRVVPELVFLNCCHLGKIDEAEDGSKANRPVPVAWNLLAASVAQQLINIGVRAVVAAGWAVGDQAGKDFGIQFYRAMLAEQGQFGEAVQHARRYIRDKHPNVNTWGAFQCYGLPTFMLGGRLRQPAGKKKPPVTQNEILEQLRRIQTDAQTAEPARLKALVDELRGHDNALRDEWRTGSALYELGESYATLRERQSAITCYENALTATETKSEVPIRTLEQLANVKVRYAAQLRSEARQREADGGEKTAASSAKRRELLQDARKRLELALKFGDTTERLSLLGSCLKRLALESDNEERRKLIRDAAECYKKAYELKSLQAQASPDPYPLLNWIPLQFLANSPEENEEQQGEFVANIEKGVQMASLRQAEQPSFWERVHAPDAALLRALIEGNLTEKQANEVTGQYREVFQTRSTAYERESVLNQLDFLSEILAWKEQHALAGQVSRLRDELEK